MVKDLVRIIRLQEESLKELLKLLDEQYNLIMNKEIFQLEAIVEKIKLANKEIAEYEVKRRKLLSNASLKDFVKENGDEKLDRAYRDINKLLNEVKLQKDTNELLLKQQLSYTAQMLNIINPRRETKTYNSYGNLSR